MSLVPLGIEVGHIHWTYEWSGHSFSNTEVSSQSALAAILNLEKYFQYPWRFKAKQKVLSCMARFYTLCCVVLYIVLMHKNKLCTKKLVNSFGNFDWIVWDTDFYLSKKQIISDFSDAPLQFCTDVSRDIIIIIST